MDQRLPTELLIQITSYLDAPAAVCFALTCHHIYKVVLLTCKVSRLEDVCPRDVRKFLPEVLAKQAYNLLIERWIKMHKSWAIENWHDAPPGDSSNMPAGYSPTDTQLLVEHLAFIRQAAWEYPELSRWNTTVLTILVDEQVFNYHNHIRVPTLTDECDAYIEHQLRTSWTRSIELEYRLVLLQHTWDQEMVESVEFMVLRDTLGEDWMKKTSNSRLKAKLGKWRRLKLSFPWYREV
ncbi:hypothetical protein H2200_000238 [Cladophialophora chaetospira]|uniref:F-box domain-containing protein n=1 Tax=Cladophialophora chaetospira TaxID=386627 RepID=A0AA38XN58_9EURO|nr:hypothetical protein H2200_000238 [Cladophialophora chaetospira]